MMSTTNTKTIERRFRDKRFAKTEKMFREIFLQNPDITSKQMAKLAGTTRFTVYRHHKGLKNMDRDYHKMLVAKFKEYMAGRNTTKAEFVCRDILIFIVRYQEFFKMATVRDEAKGLYFLIDTMRPEFERLMGLPKNSEQIWPLYADMMAEVVWLWFKNNPKLDHEEKVLNKMNFLSRSARAWLLPLVD